MLQSSPMAIKFIDSLIEEKGFKDLDDEVHAELRKDLLDRLEKRINRAIIESLTKEQLTHFEHYIDTGHIDKLGEYLYKQGINVNGITARTMAEFHASYIES